MFLGIGRGGGEYPETPISLNYPKALRTHIVRLLGPKTILYKAFGPF